MGELSYLVAKAAHSGSDGLLLEAQPARGERTAGSQRTDTLLPVRAAISLADEIAWVVAHVVGQAIGGGRLRGRRLVLLRMWRQRLGWQMDHGAGLVEMHWVSGPCQLARRANLINLGQRCTVGSGRRRGGDGVLIRLTGM